MQAITGVGGATASAALPAAFREFAVDCTREQCVRVRSRYSRAEHGDPTAMKRFVQRWPLISQYRVIGKEMRRMFTYSSRGSRSRGGLGTGILGFVMVGVAAACSGNVQLDPHQTSAGGNTAQSSNTNAVVTGGSVAQSELSRGGSVAQSELSRGGSVAQSELSRGGSVAQSELSRGGSVAQSELSRGGSVAHS